MGGGAAGIMTALQLSSKFNVYLIDQKKTLGRKLLVAGNGGFNLTNNVVQKELLAKYFPVSFLEDSLNNFTAKDLQGFLAELGIETYTGSSNRIFPTEGIKPIEVLNAFIARLEVNGVNVLLNHKVVTLNKDSVTLINASNKEIDLSFDYCVLALGGASWSKTGSDGKWIELFNGSGIKIVPFDASNCGVNVNWDKSFVENHEGKPLKNIAITVGETKLKGEALITAYGLEGNVIYPIVSELRRQLNSNLRSVIEIDFKPKNTADELLIKIQGVKPQSYVKAVNLSSHEMALIKQFTTKEEFLNPKLFVSSLKGLKIMVKSLRPIEESISTVGGISLRNLNKDFSLKENPRVFTIGEMVNWDAPTGGFLLQACFSMAYTVASAINSKIN